MDVTWMELALLLAVIAASSVLRTLPYVRKGEFGNDAYYHLLVARSVRANHRLPDMDTGMVPEGPRGYPPLFHVLLAPLAGRHEKFARLALSSCFDAATIVMVFLFAETAGLSEPIWPAVIFALSPICVLQSTSLNPRPLSCLILAVSMLSLLWYWSHEAILALVAVVVFESLMFLTHKMGVQALAAAHLATSVVIALDDPATGMIAACALPGALLLATAFTKGKYITSTLKDHIGFIKVHIRRGDYRTGRKGLPSPIELVKSDPISYFAPVAGLFLIVDGDTSIELEFLFAWALGVALLTQLWPLGDSWRHLAFGSVPSSILAVMFVVHIVGSGLAALLALAAFAAVVAFATALQLRRAMRSDMAQTIVEGLRRTPSDWRERLRGSIIYSNAVHNAVPLETGARVIGGNPNALGVEFSLELHEANKRSLAEVAKLALRAIGSEPDYYLVFRALPCPDATGYRVLYESEELRILSAEAGAADAS